MLQKLGKIKKAKKVAARLDNKLLMGPTCCRSGFSVRPVRNQECCGAGYVTIPTIPTTDVLIGMRRHLNATFT